MNRLLLQLDVFSPIPLYQQVSREIAGYISRGQVLPGERLPSVRSLARQLRLSIDTIRQAFETLEEQGLVISRPGSGHYVSRACASPVVPGMEIDAGVLDSVNSMDDNGDPRCAALWSQEAGALAAVLGSQSLMSRVKSRAELDLRPGEPTLEFLHGTRLARAVSKWCQEYLIEAPSYGNAAGLPELRIEIAAWLRRTGRVQCSAQDIFITAGIQQARDLVAQLLVSSGSEVVVEDPCHAEDILVYKSKGAGIIAVPSDESGIVTEKLAKATMARVAHIRSAAGFPAGTTLSRERRVELLDWAVDHEVLIVEDGSGDGYYYKSEVPPSLYSLARESGKDGRVIYVGSLSAHLSPSFGLGFAVVPAWLQQAFFRAKWLADRHPSQITQGLALTLMQSGMFEQHALRLIEYTRRKRAHLLKGLSRWPSGLVSYCPADAGFQQVVWFADEIDDVLICEQALAQGVAVSPASQYFIESTPRHGLVLGFTGGSEEETDRGLNKLLSIILGVRQVAASMVTELIIPTPIQNNFGMVWNSGQGA